MINRENSIDFLRGTAIIFMTITHINALYYTGNNQIMHFLTTVGATLCFSIFLFCMGYTTGSKVKTEEKPDIKKILFRSLKIYITYILISVVIILSTTGNLSLKDLSDLVLLVKPPEFADFLVSLLLFSILPALLWKPFRYIQRQPIVILFLSILALLLGNYLYTLTTEVSLPVGIQTLIENIWGYSNLHRFPLLFYLPIYLLSIYLSYSKKILNTLTTVSAIVLSYLLFFGLSPWHRWPPSLLFLTYSTTYILLVLSFVKYFPKILSFRLSRYITSIGKYPLPLFTVSTLIIFASLSVIPPSNHWLTAFIFNTFVISVLFSYPIVLYREMV